MTAYNLTPLQNAETITDIVTYANNATNEILLGLFMIGIFFIMLMVMKKWDFEDALLSSSFVCFVLSMLLRFGGYINIIFPLMFLALAAFTALYVFITKRK